MQKLDDWKAVSGTAASKRMPVIVMVDQDHCPYCRRVESEYFAAILAGGEYENKVIFGKISIDEGETIVDSDGSRIPTRKFLGRYDAGFTPTILFMDSKKNELVEKIVGLGTPDYYVYYLEKAIRQSIEIAASRA
jgi:thioredoxin-related protein